MIFLLKSRLSQRRLLNIWQPLRLRSFSDAVGIALLSFKESFEVGDEVAEAFRATGRYRTAALWNGWFRTGEGTHISTCEKSLTIMQLLPVWSATEHIKYPASAYQHHDDFFSARRLGIKTGVSVGVWLKLIIYMIHVSISRKKANKGMSGLACVAVVACDVKNTVYDRQLWRKLPKMSSRSPILLR